MDVMILFGYLAIMAAFAAAMGLYELWIDTGREKGHE